MKTCSSGVERGLGGWGRDGREEVREGREADLVEASLTRNAAVEDRILRDAAHEAKVGLARALLQPLQKAEGRFLKVCTPRPRSSRV